jgi:hypothetical protein
MGDRVSIQFVNGNEKSVVLFNHWGGIGFPNEALEYATQLYQDIKTGKVSNNMPLGRLEPQTVIVDFIRFITKNQLRISSSLYLGVDENDGDNSNNGHYIIDLVSFELSGGNE